MILEFTLGLLFQLVNYIISLLPEFSQLGIDITAGLELLAPVLYFFPMDLWVILISNFTFWLVADFSWSIVEWVYKKIPGVE